MTPRPLPRPRLAWVLTALGAPRRSDHAIQALAGTLDPLRRAAQVSYYDRWWWLREEHSEPFTLAGEEHVVTIPAGTRSDLASIPRALWWFMTPYELTVEAAYLHDRLYGLGGQLGAACFPPRDLTRRESDDAFADVMRRRGVDPIRLRMAYRAVRLFGRSSWRDGAAAGPGSGCGVAPLPPPAADRATEREVAAPRWRSGLLGPILAIPAP